MVDALPGDAEREPTRIDVPTTLRYLAAAAALVAYGGLVYYVVTHTSLPRSEWSRLFDVFTVVTGIAVAAAGALFGSHANRKRAQRAEKEADRNADKAERGTALAAAIRADATQVSARLERLGPDDPARDILERHLQYANDLLP